jgi:hypothetical protein
MNQSEDQAMKTARLLAVAVATFASLPLMMAQQINTQAQENASGSAAGAHISQSGNTSTPANASPGYAQADGSAESSLAATGAGPAHATANGAGNISSAAQMRPVTGDLEGKLDSKTAKPGDRVVLKTDKKIETADGTVIPKGSRLVGHVTQVEAHQKGHAASQMGLEFDRAELRNGQSMAIHSVIESVQPAPSAMAASSMAGEDAFETPMAGGGAAGRGAVGGGVLGGGRAGGSGLLGGTVNGATATTGRVGSDLTSTAGGAVGTTGNLSGDATGNLGRGVSGAAYGAGSLGARATGFPGVMLNSDAAGSASGMLSASDKNVHLDSGTQMVLGIAAAR